MANTYSTFHSLFFYLIIFSFWGETHAQQAGLSTIVVKVKEKAANARYATQGLDANEEKLRSLGLTNLRKVRNTKNLNTASNRRLREKAKIANDLGAIYKVMVPEVEKAKRIKQLSAEEWVEYAEPLHAYQLLYTPNDTHQGAHWGHVNTQTYEAWDISKGDTSVVIGIVDTGVKIDHPSLAPQLYYNNAERYGQAGVDDDNNGYVDDSLGYNMAEMSTNVNDIFSHGTEVSGVAAAKVNDAFGTFGTGHDTRFMPISIITSSGLIFNVFEAMLYAAENGCKVINISLGRQGGGVSQYEQDIINYITEVHDVLIIAAAGNTNGHWDFYPASYENVLSVAHSMQNDERFWTGSYSYFVDLLAPGHQVPTTYLSNGEEYKAVTGSSYAAPFVAGIAGLLRAAYPNYTAKQIAEVLRVSADDVYHLAGNINFKDKLGKGRLNTLKALQKGSSLRAVRASDFNLVGSGKGLMVRGDTANLTMSFTNFLSALSDTAKVSITSLSPHVQMLDSVFELGALNELDSINNIISPFKVSLSEALPENHQMYFKLSYIDGDYEDYQYFFLYSDAFFDITKGNWKLSLEGSGRLGYIGNEGTLYGLGLQWKNRQLIFDAGAIYGTDSTKVSDAICVVDTSKSTDFTQLTPIQTVIGDSSIEITESFYDVFKHPDTHLQQIITLHQHRPYLELNYKIANVGTDTIKDAAIGLYTNFLLDEKNINTAAWDSLYDFGYVHHQDLYFGIKLFSQSAKTTTIDRHGYTQLNPNDTFSDAGKYQMLTGELQENFTGDADVLQVNSQAFLNVAPNDTLEVPYILVAGHSLLELREQMAMAAIELDYTPYYSKSPLVQDTTLCAADSALLVWEDGEHYKYYTQKSATQPFAQGNTLKVPATSDSAIVWVSNHNSVFESEKVAVTLYFSNTTQNVSWEVPNDVVVGETFKVVANNTEGLSLHWNMGDGVQYENMDTIYHTYAEKDIYNITLGVSSEVPCVNFSSNEIVALKQSPLPAVKDTFFVCFGNDLNIAPENGNSFRFYMGDELIAEQLEYTIENIINPVSLEVSNTSDDLESDKKQIFIDIYPSPDTELISMPDSVNIAAGSLLAKAAYGLEWTWTTSKGQSGNGQDFEITLDSVGTQIVQLLVKDTLGCTYIEEKELYVWQNTITSVNNVLLPNGRVLNEVVIFPSPAQSYLNIARFPQIESSDIELHTLKGKMLSINVQKQPHFYRIDLSKIPSGMYLLKISLRDKTYTKKVLKE